MTEIERKKQIRRTTEYIFLGKTEGTIEDCISSQLAEEISDLKEYETNLNPKYFCLNLGARLIGMNNNGTVYVEYPVKDTSRNGMGNLQGGLLASLIDNAMGILVVPAFGPFLTMNLDINYFLPISKEFDTVLIKAKIVKPGKRTKYLRAEVYRSDGKLAAVAGSNVMMVKNEKENSND